MGWRFYNRRALSGTWVNTDVPLRALVTEELDGPGLIVATLPDAFDTPAEDGSPAWVERGTLLFAEDGNRLQAVGLLRFTRPTDEGRLLEFAGMASLYDLVAFSGRIRQWEADPFDLVAELLRDAHDQPDGDLGMRVTRVGRAPDHAGDIQPPDSPEKPKRRRQETPAHFQGRLEEWEKERQKWEKEYGDREPYALGWWEQQYVGTEIAELAEECRFEVSERHTWTDRDQLQARHELVVAPRRARRRDDLTLVEGVNLFGQVDPETSLDTYGNHVVALGAGEGRKMRRAQYGVRDGRVRTTRFVEAKTVRSVKRLRQRARVKAGRSEVVTRLAEALVPDEVAALVNLGDELEVVVGGFRAWQRVVSKTRDTGGDLATLRFDDGEGRL